MCRRFLGGFFWGGGFCRSCYYFGQSLTDELGPDAPPIGLIHTAWGGSMIEQWLPAETVDSCQMSCRSGGHWLVHSLSLSARFHSIPMSVRPPKTPDPNYSVWLGIGLKRPRKLGTEPDLTFTFLFQKRVSITTSLR